jgi:hypothetical protein
MVKALTPEEDAIGDPDDDSDDIDEMLPADLWFRYGRNRGDPVRYSRGDGALS